MGCRPSLLFCRPERSEGSLGACAPRDDIPKRRPERSDEGRRPERSEGCLANARQDKKGRSAGQSRGDLFLNSLNRTISFKKLPLCSVEKSHVSPLGGLSFRAAS